MRRRAALAVTGAVAAAVVVAALAVLLMPTRPPQDHPIVLAGHGLAAAAFSELPGWDSDDPAEALAAFRRSCAKIGDEAALAAACSALARLPEDADAAAARDFFESSFRPWRVVPSDGDGMLTAYYEPVVAGSREPTDEFQTPLYRLPEGHVTVGDGNRPEDFDASLVAARQTEEGLVPWPTRGEIENGALGDLAVPLVHVADPVDAFFIHIQGSTRIALADGSTMRVGYAGKNGYPYTSVGRVMQERGIRPPGGLSMDGMRAFFAENPEQARELMHENRSFIFFREVTGLGDELGPVGAQGVALTSGRSLAVDPAFHALGTPVFVSASLPIGENREPRPFRRLMVAQDTGSAIKGPARGDLFWGTGPEAGSVAGGIKAPGDFYVLLPR